MNFKFPDNLEDARKLQKSLAGKTIIKDTFSKISTICAFDVAYKDKMGYAAGVVVDVDKNKVIETKVYSGEIPVPYIPTFLFLREVPFFLKLLCKLSASPDLFLIDGHGIAHPFFAGSATIFGVIADKPTIGVAKKPLRGFKDRESEKGDYTYVSIKDKIVGIKYSVKETWKPIYISPGNRCSINTSFEIIKKHLSTKRKLPLPLHLAHITAADAKNR
jgi:deoxyribonuclease V